MFIIGLKPDGSVISTKIADDPDYTWNRIAVDGWKDVIAVSAGGFHTVGLKSDGTVVATSDGEAGEFAVDDWKDIVAISAGAYHTVGLKSDGTVVSVGKDIFDKERPELKKWKNIVAVSAGYYFTVGLKADGSMVAAPFEGDDEFDADLIDFDEWKDIVISMKRN